MQSEDQRFVEGCCDPTRRAGALRSWRRTRRLSLVAAGVFLLLALGTLLLGDGALCGLFGAVSAINYAAAMAADMKVKLALLAERGFGTPPGEAATRERSGSLRPPGASPGEAGT